MKFNPFSIEIRKNLFEFDLITIEFEKEDGARSLFAIRYDKRNRLKRIFNLHWLFDFNKEVITTYAEVKE